MPQPALNLIAQAGQIAKTGNVSPSTGALTGYVTQALSALQSLSDFLCETIDFSAAMGTFTFTMNTNLVNIGANSIVQAAPSPLPMDYLRVQTSGGVTGAQRSSIWYLNGVPRPMIEIDLTEWDNQVQQAGIQSYPYLWAKDMSQRAIVVNAIGDISTSTTTVNNVSVIGPGSNTAVSGVAGIVAGMSVAGGIGPLSLITPGTTITAVGSTTLTLSQAPSLPNGQTVSLTGASLIIGYPPVGLPYPPPSGAFTTRLRYQRLMPPLTQAQINAGAYFWFPDDMVVIEGLAGLLSRYSDDTRTIEFIGDGLQAGEAGGRFGKRLAQYTRTADDRSDRSQAVQLDRRSFGRDFSSLKNTKTVGW